MKIIKSLLVLLLAAGILLGLFGCSKKYHIVCDGDKKDWLGIKSSYKEGEQVVIWYQVMATDADLTIVVDGEVVSYTYEGGKGFRVEFTMPAHDVEVRGVWKANGLA